MSDSVFIGIDVSSHTPEIASSDQFKTWQVANDVSGIEQLVHQAIALAPALVVLEATGGYEFEAACRPRAWRWPWSTRARYVTSPAPRGHWPRPTHWLRACWWPSPTCCTNMPSANASLSRWPTPSSARPSIERVIEFLKHEIGDSEAQATTHLQRLHAALVGVAPLNRDSGQMRGQRCIWGGRADVRQTLYMTTITAVRHNSALHACYERLRVAGKRKNVAQVTCMRKLLTMLNDIAKHGSMWDSTMHSAWRARRLLSRTNATPLTQALDKPSVPRLLTMLPWACRPVELTNYRKSGSSPEASQCSPRLCNRCPIA
ncbi:transposase IS116/IS110/IS902 family protein [Delftia sp. Cs1-4]|nr:transposase IS116/IS110/IS902 family protein [Delftia sp. Cs1-4]EZP56036.1 Transposase IS116/IS110/IS902 family protein [Delftia sp. RIT313]SOE35597.1 transposase [Delftia acidovorans]